METTSAILANCATPAIDAFPKTGAPPATGLSPVNNQASATSPAPATNPAQATIPSSATATAATAAVVAAALLLVFAAVPAARAQIILSEIFPDPASLADARGEFVELANAGPGREAAEAAWLIVEGDSLALGAVDLGPGDFLVLCRDSAALAGFGVRCGRAAPELALANGRPLRVAVAWRDLRSDFEVPASSPGRSWENTFDDERGLREFARSGRAFLDGDSATPGFRNSRSLRPAARDLALRDVALLPGGILSAEVEDRGRRSAGAGLSLRLDADWDGVAETPVDSAAVAPGGGRVRFALGSDHLGILHLRLDEDEDPAGDLRRIPRLEGRTLEISEVCPAPDAGPEWAEIRNVSGSAGFARPFDLSRVAWDGEPLGQGAGRLGPGEYLLLTEDGPALRAALGPLKARILEVPGWGSLRNSGDTCRLSLEGHALDSLAYGAREAAAAPCLARPPGESGPTPGFAEGPPPANPRLSVSPRILDPGGEFAIEAEVPPPAAFDLRVFDLEGNVLRVLARGGPGRRSLGWSGDGGSGRRLPPGPYLLALSVGGRAPVRKVVVLSGAP